MRGAFHYTPQLADREQSCFVIDDSEQLDITPHQAWALTAAGLIYQPDPEENPAYFTTPWNVSLDNIDVMLECGTCGGTGRWETTTEDHPARLVDCGPCRECPLSYDATSLALDNIATILRDPDWAPGMLEDIAEIVTATGRDLTNPTDEPTWDRH